SCGTTLPVCSCKIGSESVDLSSNSNTNVALVGAVGALSSLSLIGSGIGVYFLAKKLCCKQRFLNRSSSTLSKESLLMRNKRVSPPPGYEDNQNSTNIYRAGLADDINHHVAPRWGKQTRRFDDG
ncbi:hypothetical protein FSP39_013006, partial [Pinctada imbricata]